jgi:hypothetical protein
MAEAMATLALIRAENKIVAQSHRNNTEGVLRAILISSSSQKVRPCFAKSAATIRLVSLPRETTNNAPLAPNAGITMTYRLRSTGDSKIKTAFQAKARPGRDRHKFDLDNRRFVTARSGKVRREINATA